MDKIKYFTGYQLDKELASLFSLEVKVQSTEFLMTLEESFNIALPEKTKIIVVDPSMIMKSKNSFSMHYLRMNGGKVYVPLTKQDFDGMFFSDITKKLTDSFDERGIKYNPISILLVNGSYMLESDYLR
jgi:hypothetical protein